jgi:hypothetical protein
MLVGDVVTERIWTVFVHDLCMVDGTCTFHVVFEILPSCFEGQVSNVHFIDIRSCGCLVATFILVRISLPIIDITVRIPIRVAVVATVVIIIMTIFSATTTMVIMTVGF